MNFALQCQVCAWREHCQKKHRLQGEAGQTRCPDFTRDLTLPTEPKDKRSDEKQA
jgi:hypothetical protein